MVVRLLIYTLFFTFLVFNCKSNDTIKNDVKKNKFKESKINFEKEKKEFESCKNKYEKSHGHKIVVDVRNGSGTSGLAKQVSNYLRGLCYDTYYDNWVRPNEYYSKIILHKQDTKMNAQLKSDLGNKINEDRELAPNKEADITLVIGQNYKELEFYKKMNK